MVCQSQDTAVAGNSTACCICHPCPHAMKTEKLMWTWLLLNHFAMSVLSLAALQHGLCLAHIQTHRPAQPFKNLIDSNSYASNC